MQKKPTLRFPKSFLWGASTSAHQVEGGTHNQWSVWELENAASKAAQAPYQWGDLASWEFNRELAEQPDNYISGKAVDHFKRFETDFDLLEQMNLNAFRFSIEWSRIEPEEGAWNAEAITYYRRYLKELKKRKIEPIVTLFHFTVPVWFEAKGGFLKRTNVQDFVRFADKITAELGADVRYVITLNEPEVYAYESFFQGGWPPNVTSKRAMWRVLNNLAYAHNQVAEIIHAANPRTKVSVAKNSCYFYPGDDAWLSQKSAVVMQYFQDDYFLKKVVKNCDFLGVNFYLSNRVYGYRIHSPMNKVSDMGWDMSPGDIQFVLERLYDRYKLPIIITENGLADGQDNERKWWLTQTISGIQKAMENGVKVRGYLHWSLLDNFEWDKGFWPRFGLVAVDRSTMQRELRPSGKWYGKLVGMIRARDK